MAILGLVRTVRCSHGKHPHEHNLRIEFGFEGSIHNGKVAELDFHQLEQLVDSKLSPLEGKNLDQCFGRGTVEALAIHLLKEMESMPLASVTVWETADRYVQVRPSAGDF